MTAFDKTWANGTNPTEFVGKRTLDKVEAEAAKMLLVKRTNCTFADRKANRALNTVYTNGTSTGLTANKPVLVIVTVKQDATGGATKESTTEVHAILDPSGTPVTIGQVASEAPALLSRSARRMVYLIVNPGEAFKIQESNSPGSGGGSCTNTIEHWWEFQLDAAHLANTYTTGENPPIDRLNLYANDVSAIGQLDGAMSHSNPANNWGDQRDLAAGSALTFVIQNIRSSSITTAGNAKVQSKNSGGTLTDFAQVSWDQAESQWIQSVAFFVNHEGSYKGVTVAGSPTYESRWELEFIVPTGIGFTNGEGPGSTTGNKFRDLDTNASKGFNHTLGFTRTDAGTGAGSRTPSTTKWAFVIVSVDLQNDAAADPRADVRIPAAGTVRASIQVPDSATVGGKMMMLVVVPANTSYDVSISGAGSAILQRFEWVPQ